jgi:membrane protein DedA with SNARE-associated domain
MYASIVDSIVTVATNFIDSAGALGVFVLMTLESACVPIPSEAIMLFAGFNVSEGNLTMVAVVVAGVLGNVVGSCIAYAAGYYARIDLLEKSRIIHVSHARLAQADRWFERYGDATVFFSRMLPIVRTFISLPAGIARMPFWRFVILTTLGCIPWVVLLAVVGREVGDQWDQWKDHLRYLDYAVVVAIVGGGIYLVIRYRRRRGTPAADTEP